MAKGLRSTIKMRFRTAKRKKLERTLMPKIALRANSMVSAIHQGIYIVHKKAPNAFLFPHAPDASVPQVVIEKKEDFRSEALPEAAGCAYGTINRKSLAERRQEQDEYFQLLRGEVKPSDMEIVKEEEKENHMELDSVRECLRPPRNRAKALPIVPLKINNLKKLRTCSRGTK
eukprot:Platyproteum_vivax@DN5064_c0_g1_i1.p1